MKKLLSLLSLFAFPAGAESMAANHQPSVAVQGTEFVLRSADGRVIRGEDLNGATLNLQTGRIKIAAVERDRKSVGGPVFLYHFLVEQGGQFVELCDPDPDGRRLGFPYSNGTGSLSLTCTSGAEGKCIRLGYRPWEAPIRGIPVRGLHRACVNLIRADYGGDGNATTRNGTRIDIYDRFGIQKPAAHDHMAFEAAWGVNGAVCVAHPRIRQKISLQDLAARYPSLRGALGREACSERIMRKRPDVLLFNKSDDGDPTMTARKVSRAAASQKSFTRGRSRRRERPAAAFPPAFDYQG